MDAQIRVMHGAELIADNLESESRMLADFEKALVLNLSRDAADNLAYLAPNRVNLALTHERWPDIVFHETREHAVKLND